MICHVDADAFFASALQRKRPDLQGKPLLALGMNGSCVIAASYEAKAEGVQTGMRLREARQLCPQAAAVPSDFDEALLASQQIEQILRDICPVVERMSVDEWFLDCSALPGGGPEQCMLWARTLQEQVSRSTHLTVSVGIAPSKLLAKMASEYCKPAGATVVDSNEDSAISVDTFLRDRPAEAIPGVGSRRAVHCEAQGWRTAYDVAHADTEILLRLFGRPGLDLRRELHGHCLDPVGESDAPPQSLSRCRSFLPHSDREYLFSHLLHHLTYTVLKMRRHGLRCRRIAVSLRTAAFERRGRDSKLAEPADTEEQLLPYLRDCFDRVYATNQSYTQAALVLADLVAADGMQYSLFEETRRVDTRQQMQEALDALHNRFGREAVKRGSAMPGENCAGRHLNILGEAA